MFKQVVITFCRRGEDELNNLKFYKNTNRKDWTEVYVYYKCPIYIELSLQYHD